MRIVAAFATVCAMTACGASDERSRGDVLEPLHGPVDPDVLAEPAAVAAPVTEPDPATDPWRVSNVIDGRTLELYRGLERVTATVGGIVVPTEDQCLADLATDSLTFITGGGRPVDVTPSTPRQNRILDAVIITAGGDDVAEAMLSLGLAEIDRDAPTRSAYEDAEGAARRSALGIWSDECAEG